MINQHEQIIRQAKIFGNGAHIFVPKEWAGQEIILLRKNKSIKEKILHLLEPHLEKIIGAYLYGSRARGEAEYDSDIDLLIITNTKLNLKIDGFEIISLIEDEVESARKKEPILFYSILQEAKPIINSGFLEGLKEYGLKKSDIKDYIKDTKKMIKKDEELLRLDEQSDENSSLELIYSIMLRLRGIFIIKSLLRGQIYSKEKFKRWTVNSGIDSALYEKMYKIYKSVKNNCSSKEIININEAKKALNLLKKEIKKLK